MLCLDLILFSNSRWSIVRNRWDHFSSFHHAYLIFHTFLLYVLTRSIEYSCPHLFDKNKKNPKSFKEFKDHWPVTDVIPWPNIVILSDNIQTRMPRFKSSFKNSMSLFKTQKSGHTMKIDISFSICMTWWWKFVAIWGSRLTMENIILFARKLLKWCYVHFHS